MTIAIIGIIIGVLVFGAGIYYLAKEKEDPESKKIYSIIAAVGALIVVGMVLKLVLFRATCSKGEVNFGFAFCLSGRAFSGTIEPMTEKEERT